MQESKKQIAVRITPSEHKLLSIVAGEEGRTINGEIAYLIKRRIAQYRESNPEIQMDFFKGSK